MCDGGANIMVDSCSFFFVIIPFLHFLLIFLTLFLYFFFFFFVLLLFSFFSLFFTPKKPFHFQFKFLVLFFGYGCQFPKNPHSTIMMLLHVYSMVFSHTTMMIHFFSLSHHTQCFSQNVCRLLLLHHHHFHDHHFHDHLFHNKTKT